MLPEQIGWLLHEFTVLSSDRFPYVYGGGHGVAPEKGLTFPPTKGVDPEGTNPKGYDCSAWQSAGLWHAGMLGSGSIKDTKLAPGTEELAGWGVAGVGEFYTLYVKNAPGYHHCVGKLTLSGKPVLWTAAASTGTICGWWSYGSWDPTTEGYIARHHPGL